MDLVRWVSGLNQQFAKLSYGFPYRGFESPSHRRRDLALMPGLFFFTPYSEFIKVWISIYGCTLLDYVHKKNDRKS